MQHSHHKARGALETAVLFAAPSTAARGSWSSQYGAAAMLADLDKLVCGLRCCSRGGGGGGGAAATRARVIQPGGHMRLVQDAVADRVVPDLRSFAIACSNWGCSSLG